jgi:fructose-1,6-bisphosphatase I
MVASIFRLDSLMALTIILVVLCMTRHSAAFQASKNGTPQRRSMIVPTTEDIHKKTTKLFSSVSSSTPFKPKKKKFKSFQRHLEIECWKRPELRELEPVLQAVAESCKQINRIVQRAQTDDLYGPALGPDGLPLEDNIQGEVQQQLDVLCNTIMLRAFCGCSSSIHSVASEEEDESRCCSDVMVSVMCAGLMVNH